MALRDSEKTNVFENKTSYLFLSVTLTRLHHRNGEGGACAVFTVTVLHYSVTGCDCFCICIIKARSGSLSCVFCPLIGPAYILRGPAADHGVLVLGAAGRHHGSAGIRGGRAAGGRVRHHPGHIARHDCGAHCRSDGKTCVKGRDGGRRILLFERICSSLCSKAQRSCTEP